MNIIIDIETDDVPAEEQEIERDYIPLGNTKDPEKIKKKKEEIRLGTCDLSPIWCIGARTQGISYIFSMAVLKKEEILLLESFGIVNVICGDEKELLCEFSKFMSIAGKDSHLFAAGEFDKKHITFRHWYNSLYVPHEFLACKYHDLMRRYSDVSVSNRTGFASVVEMCRKFKIPFQKAIEGHEISSYIRKGRHVELLLYNHCDLIAEEQIAIRMYGGFLF